MGVDLAQVKRINDLAAEITDFRIKRKEVNRQIAELPEAVALKEAQIALEQATEDLRLAMRSNRDYARLAVLRGELNWTLRDLEDQLSNTIRAFHEDSGRNVVPDPSGVKRAIEARYSLGKPALDQARLPLGLSRHFEQRIEIVEISKQGTL